MAEFLQPLEAEAKEDAAVQQPALEELFSAVESFEHAMLVTRSEGKLRSRPMAIADISDAGGFWFMTDAASRKLDELAADPHVNIALQKGARFCSISGTARVVRDPAKAQALWSEGQRAWFPDGPADARLVLIEVVPEYAEYWNRSGVEALRYSFAAAQAIAMGRALGEDAGKHSKLKL